MKSDVSFPARRTTIVGDLLRGALIGVVETVPGVSGGTVALVVGIYTRLIVAASHVISALKVCITGPNRAAQELTHLRAVEWKLVIPVFIGMLLAVFTIAGPMVALVETYPEPMRALFFGMVLASVGIPLQFAGFTSLRLPHMFAGVLAAAATFWIVSIPPTQVTPTPLIVVLSAAVAVSALLLPGLSGSFLLLTFGLYEPTLSAVAERDLAYLGLFILGLFLGVALMVKGLEWLLLNRRRITLVVLAGVMVGAMRTLWPWQTETRQLLPPEAGWGFELALAAAGFVVVAVLAVVDARMSVTARPSSTNEC